MCVPVGRILTGFGQVEAKPLLGFCCEEYSIVYECTKNLRPITRELRREPILQGIHTRFSIRVATDCDSITSGETCSKTRTRVRRNFFFFRIASFHTKMWPGEISQRPGTTLPSVILTVPRTRTKTSKFPCAEH